MKKNCLRLRRRRHLAVQAARRPYLKFQLFEYFTFFVAVLISILWIFQTLLLDDFYQSVKLYELKRAAGMIASTLDREDFDAIANNIAVDNAVCVLVFDGEGKQVTSCDVQVDCLIHHTDPDTINGFYAEALAQGGESVRRVKRTFFRFQDQQGAPGDGLEDSIVLTKIAQNAAGDSYIILLNTVIAPVSATVSTLQIQLVCISALMLVLALLLALLMSRNISGPIAKLNGSAKALADGRYEADFSVGRGGCREVGELSDTLTRAARELSKVDRIQKELIANISHDLRTPLTLIKGYGEVMRDIPGEMTPKNMQVIIDETERLSSLVTDLVDVSRLQAGAPQLSLSDFDLGETVQETLTRYKKLTERDGYVLSLDCDGPLPVTADRARMLQVIYNLVNNAINYTGEDKHIYARAYRCEGCARVEIRDTGEGIEADKLALIWDRYFKIDRVHRRAAVGTGLGLSIVKNILTLHGAKYGVDSTLGEGSVFWFELPLRDETKDNGEENGNTTDGTV